MTSSAASRLSTWTLSTWIRSPSHCCNAPCTRNWVAADKASLLPEIASQIGPHALLDFALLGALEAARLIARTDGALFRRESSFTRNRERLCRLGGDDYLVFKDSGSLTRSRRPSKEVEDSSA